MRGRSELPVDQPDQPMLAVHDVRVADVAVCPHVACKRQRSLRLSSDGRDEAGRGLVQAAQPRGQPAEFDGVGGIVVLPRRCAVSDAVEVLEDLATLLIDPKKPW